MIDSKAAQKRVPGGVVHKLPADLRQALLTNTTAHRLQCRRARRDEAARR